MSAHGLLVIFGIDNDYIIFLIYHTKLNKAY